MKVCGVPTLKSIPGSAVLVRKCIIANESDRPSGSTSCNQSKLTCFIY